MMRIGAVGVTVLALGAAILAAAPAQAATSNIFTIAGTGTAGFSGDGGPAAGANLFPRSGWRSPRTAAS
jgi:hypothetical protein